MFGRGAASRFRGGLYEVIVAGVGSLLPEN